MTDEKEIVAVQAEIVKGSRRKITTLLQRRSWAKIYAHLTNPMQDAAREIETAFTFITNGTGYGIHDLNHVSGHIDIEPSEYMRLMVERYTKWKGHSPKITNKVINMFVGGKPLSELSAQYGVTKKTCMAHIREGLNEYCIIAGWGNQLKDKTN